MQDGVSGAMPGTNPLRMTVSPPERSVVWPLEEGLLLYYSLIVGLPYYIMLNS